MWLLCYCTAACAMARGRGACQLDIAQAGA